MIHIPFHLTGEAAFALVCAAGILAPFVVKLAEPAQLKPQSKSAQAKRPDDPATLALVERLQSQR